MGSLTKCLTNAGKLLDRELVNDIQNAAQGFRGEGMTPEAAAFEAVTTVLNQELETANAYAAQLNQRLNTNVQFSMRGAARQETRTPKTPLAEALPKAAIGQRVGRVLTIGEQNLKFAQIVDGWINLLSGGGEFDAIAGIPQRIVLADLKSMKEQTGFETSIPANGVSIQIVEKDGKVTAFIGIDYAQIKQSADTWFKMPGGGRDDGVIIETIAHEFGHMVERLMLSSADPKLRAQIIDSHYQYMQNTPGLQAAMNRLTPLRAQMLAGAKRGGALNPEWANSEYVRSFHEWFADNVAKFLLTDAKPRSVVEQFFDKVAQVLRSIYNSITGTQNPDYFVKTFMQRRMEFAARYRAGDLDVLKELHNPNRINDLIENAGKEDFDVKYTAEDIAPAETSQEEIRALYDELDARSRRRGSLGASIKRALDDVMRGIKPSAPDIGKTSMGNALRRVRFALLTREQIADFFRTIKDTKFYDLITKFNDATFKADQLANNVRQNIDKAIGEMQTLSRKVQDGLHLVMHDARMMEINPDVPFDHEWNKHLITKDESYTNLKRAQHAQLQARLRVLDHLATVEGKDGKKDTNRASRVYSQLRAGLKELSDQRVDKQVAVHKAQIEEIMAEVTGSPTPKQEGQIKALKTQIAQLEEMKEMRAKGPWFPLRRQGEWLVTLPLPIRIIRDKDNQLFPADDLEGNKKKLAAYVAANKDPKAELKPVYDNEKDKKDRKLLGYQIESPRNAVFFFDSEAEALASQNFMHSEILRLWADDQITPEDALAHIQQETDRRQKDGETGYNPYTPKLMSEFYRTEKYGSDTAAFDEIEGILDEYAKALPATLFEALRQARLEASADYALKQSALSSQNVIGASHDMSAGIVEWAYGASHSYGSMVYADDITKSWKGLVKLAENRYDPNHKNRLLARDALATNEQLTTERRATTTMNTVLNTATQFSSLWSLAFNPAYVMINAAQPHVVTTPVLAAMIDTKGNAVGMKKAHGYILDAMRGANNDRSAPSALMTATVRGANDFATHLKTLFGKASNIEMTPDQIFYELIKEYARNDTEKTLLRNLRDSGKLDFGHLTALQDAMATGPITGKVQQMTRLGMAFAQHVETMNRTITALAAYRLAVNDLGMSPDIAESQHVGYLHTAMTTEKWVSDILNETMVNYTMVNRPNVFKYQLSAPALQFRMYAQTLYMTFIKYAGMALRGTTPEERRVGWRAVSGLLLTHSVMAGSMGLGLFTFIAQVAAYMFAYATGDEEERDRLSWMNLDNIHESVVKDFLGEGVASEAVLRGLPSALAGIDLSGNIGIPSLIDTRFMNLRESDTNQEAYDKVLIYALGPTYATIKRALTGTYATGGEFIDFAQGQARSDDVLRELAGASPSGLRAVVESMRYATEGVSQRDGDRMILAEDLSTYDTFIRALNLRPTSVSTLNARRGYEAKIRGRITAEKADVLQFYRTAKAGGDPGELENARQRIRDFNRTVPKAFQIQPSQAERSYAGKVRREAGETDKQTKAIKELAQ